MAPALASRSPSCYRIHRTCFLPGDFVLQCCVGTGRHRFVTLNMTLLHLSLPLRYFQAFILSSDYFSSSSHFQSCSLLLLLFSSAVIAVSPSPIYLLLLVAETTLWNHTANKSPFSPGRPILAGRNRRTSVTRHQARRRRGEGFACYHWPLSLCSLLVKGSGPRGSVWDSAQQGRGQGPWSYFPCVLSASVEGTAEMQTGSQAAQHPLLRTRRDCNFSTGRSPVRQRPLCSSPDHFPLTAFLPCDLTSTCTSIPCQKCAPSLDGSCVQFLS